LTSQSIGTVSDGAPIGPSAAEEAALLAEEDIGPPAVAVTPAPAAAKKLPTLDSLVARISPATKTAFDEHLRARFVRVRRLNPGELR
jgi:hypothetical protein